MKHILKATKEYKKITECVSDAIPLLSLAAIKSQIRQGEVKLNDTRITHDCAVKTGDTIKIFLPASLEPKTVSVDFVYDSPHVAVVHKPVLCETETHLTQMVQATYPNAVPVHRLDRNTTGLVVFAKTTAAEEALLRLFKAHKVEKKYRATVMGKPKKSDSITVYLYKDAKHARVWVRDQPSQGYKAATLAYTVTRQYENHADIDINLVTGRTHQIRATMMHVGHPVIGDSKYGNEKVNREHKAAFPKLCAYKIKFAHAEEDCALLKELAGVEVLLKESKNSNTKPKGVAIAKPQFAKPK